ncbi:cysteine--tRNA ligase [Patescibacteria group bacterium]|nr:cysteine--tRNA ligase [Patescibacteria group bacterium]
MMLKLYNSLARKIEEFKPVKKTKVGMYTCGPTVYNYAHIGNLRTYVFEDILKKVLRANGYKVKHVMNITDVGHLTSDADQGEDKIEKGSKREGKTAWEIADFYTKAFKSDIKDLGIEEPNVWCRATEHIKQQIKLIKRLEKKGFTYQTADGIYFDTSKLSDYGRLANLQHQELRAGARVDVGDKKNITDFALWKFSPKLETRQMEWLSPWGMGFPGWHVECSAMAEEYLGQPFDIHCGGIDHLSVHHPNEMAQSEAAYGKPLANYWLHGEFLLIPGGEKMAKSDENFITLDTLKKRGINPLSYRYFLLQTHYRKQLTFSWEALEAAQNGLQHLYRSATVISNQTDFSSAEALAKAQESLKTKFFEHINDDLDTPGALALIWTALKDKTISLETLLKLDEVLGLKIKENMEQKEEELPEKIKMLISERDNARAEKDWTKSDDIRGKLEKMGYEVEDTKDGQKICKLL